MESILSTGERRVAELLATGHDVEAVADRRGESIDATKKAVDRIREKTNWALVTLLESPFTESVVADLSPEERDRLRSALDVE